MEFTGRYVIPATPDQVWTALNDPAVLQLCIPGCENLARDGDHHFVATATLRIGPVKATFKGAIEQSELDPPRRCVLKGEGLGGVAGFARGAAEVVLEQEAGSTVLSYAARATIGGKLAQVGQRLIDGAAKQIADDFFARFSAAVATQSQLASPVEEALLKTPPSQPLDESPIIADKPVREGLAPEIWVIGLMAIVVILLVLFGMAL
ncbi:MAG TPA: carbon monoxide dehydrogenase subunit G [Rhizomicrobium sp.]|nr:carbon monoxide dehydrogenase subunit G [Rhizomicrobium sp.]